MMLTENEASKKWCPEIRTGLIHGIAVNHHIDMEPKGQGVYDETRCIGSGCMMWRWKYREDGRAAIQNSDGSKLGFCGKAGIP